MLPVLIMVIIGSTFFGEVDDLPIGVIDRDGSELSRTRIDRVLDDSPALATARTPIVDALELDIRTGRIHAGLVIGSQAASTSS